MAWVLVDCSHCDTRFPVEEVSLHDPPVCPSCGSSSIPLPARVQSLGAPELDDEEFTPDLQASSTQLVGTPLSVLKTPKKQGRGWLVAASLIVTIAGIAAVRFLQTPSKKTPANAAAPISGPRPSVLADQFNDLHRGWQIRDEERTAASDAPMTPPPNKPVSVPPPRENVPLVEISTDRGKFVMELLDQEAPGLVSLFLDQVERGMYDEVWLAGTNDRIRSGTRYVRPYFLGEGPKWRKPKFDYEPLAPGDVCLVNPTSAAGFVIHRSPTASQYWPWDRRFARVVEGLDVPPKLQRGDKLKVNVLQMPSNRPPPNVETAVEWVKDDEAAVAAELDEEKRLDRLAAEHGPLPQVEVTTPAGKVILELFEDQAPKIVAHFLQQAEQGSYDGLKFGPVVPGLIAQAGDLAKWDVTQPEHRVPSEVSSRKHLPGAVGVSHNSRSLHFYFCLTRIPQLDNSGYTVFGRVIEGLELLDKIKQWDDMTVKVVRKRASSIPSSP